MNGILKYFSKFSSFGRIISHIEMIETAYKPTKKQLKQAEDLKKQLHTTIIKASIVAFIRNIFYFMLYFSVITAFIAAVTKGLNISFITDSVKIISSIIGGTAVIVVLAFVFDRLKNLYFIDMLLLAGTINSIYTTKEKDTDWKNVLSSLFASKVHLRRNAKSK